MGKLRQIMGKLRQITAAKLRSENYGRLRQKTYVFFSKLWSVTQKNICFPQITQITVGYGLFFIKT